MNSHIDNAGPQYRTFNDADRIKLSTREKSARWGPIEVAPCAHGGAYTFRYEWTDGSGGPKDGELVILGNKCLDCALLGEMQTGRRKLG